MPQKKQFAQELANTFLAGKWKVEDLLKRLEKTLDYIPVWGEPLIHTIHNHFAEVYPYISTKDLSEYILENSLFKEAWSQYRYVYGHGLVIRSYNLEIPVSSPPIIKCDIPRFKTIKELADWFAITPQHLEGFSDCNGFERKSAQSHQRHYHYIWKKKHIGTTRLLEIPKSNLRAIQRQINTQILQKIPLHSSCHGFRQGHSCITYAQVHCKKTVVIRIDLQRFFTSIPLRRIHAIFEIIGYRTELARILTGLCSNQVPHDILKLNSKSAWQERKQLSTPHLPQGAPCSPTLANLSAFKLDMRLSALMNEMGGKYTRYADDLAFSGDFSQGSINRLCVLVAQIVKDEGFCVNELKTKIMKKGGRQQLTGLMLNQHVNYPRDKYDKLKAILFNCVRFGAESQNRAGHQDFKAHLQGKISYVKSVNPKRAVRLQKLFDKIIWL